MSAMLKQKLIDIANGFTKYGLWKGGGSSNLSELNDVTLTNLQKNDVLTYNGSEWVNDDNLQTQINTLNSNFSSMNYSMYSELRSLGLVYSEELTTEEIVSKMPDSSILITAVWRSSIPNLHYSNVTNNERCIYIIIKPLEGYTIIKHFEVDTGNMYICGYRDNRFSDWHSI